MQGYRQVEIDCWDGRHDPVVTHGHTFCTVEELENVARAIAECAFVTSNLAVVLSLEMHCAPKQQKRVAEIFVKHLGEKLIRVRDALSDTLMPLRRVAHSLLRLHVFACSDVADWTFLRQSQCDELEAMGPPTLGQLNHRVLLKGKIKRRRSKCHDQKSAFNRIGFRIKRDSSRSTVIQVAPSLLMRQAAVSQTSPERLTLSGCGEEVPKQSFKSVDDDAVRHPAVHAGLSRCPRKRISTSLSPQ